MKLKHYPKYKESKVQWIGEVPEGWDINKIKRTTYVKGRIGWQGLSTEEYQDIGAFLITGTDFTEGEIDWSSCNHVSWERYKEDPYIHIKENDLLITKDGTIGKVALVKNMPDKTTLNSGVFVTRPLNKKYETQHMYWILNSLIFERFIDFMKRGATILHLYQETFEEFVFPIPSKSEQIQISSFLDTKTSEIDSILCKDKQLIELLKEKRIALINHVVTKGLNPKVKLKDSRIEWIGEVPEGWEIKKIKNFTTEKRNKATKTNDSGHFIGLENIESMSGKLISYNSTENLEGESLKFKKGNVLFCKLRPYLAKVIVSDTDGFCTTELIIYECDEKTNPVFLKYRLLSNGYIEYVNSLTDGVKMPRADPIQLSNIKLPLPPLPEQLQIASYLDKETSKIDQTIKKIEEKITLMEEYKKSLIHHVVTGKVDVREAVA